MHEEPLWLTRTSPHSHRKNEKGQGRHSHSRRVLGIPSPLDAIESGEHPRVSGAVIDRPLTWVFCFRRSFALLPFGGIAFYTIFPGSHVVPGPRFQLDVGRRVRAARSGTTGGFSGSGLSAGVFGRPVDFQSGPDMSTVDGAFE